MEATSLFVSAPDGLRLHVRHYGERIAPGLPIVCLPGLTRTAADFETVAAALSTNGARPRRVLALDYRGRGLSDRDPDPGRYSLPVELNDLLAVLTALDVGRAVFLGTSRGGLLTLLLAPTRPTAIAGAILNDIGPVVELAGLLRIKSYVGRLPRPASFEDGAGILRRLFAAQFPNLGDADWLAAARRGFVERHGRLEPSYDPALAATLQAVGPEAPLPALWPQFDALAAVPVMVIRGLLSDILSAETVAAMRARRPDLDLVEVPDQGHTPLLNDAATIGRIEDFVAGIEARAGVSAP